jgi:hypothetical protein
MPAARVSSRAVSVVSPETINAGVTWPRERRKSPTAAIRSSVRKRRRHNQIRQFTAIAVSTAGASSPGDSTSPRGEQRAHRIDDHRIVVDDGNQVAREAHWGNDIGVRLAVWAVSTRRRARDTASSPKPRSAP